MPKYSIIDADDQVTGFLVIQLPTTFEHTSGKIATDGPIADVILLFASLTGFTTVAWLAGGPDWLAPVSGVIITGTLAGIKAWRGGWREDETPKSEELTIKVESWQDDGPVLLDEIQDKSISLDEWRKTARSIIIEGLNFSRPALTKSTNKAKITQTTFHKVKNEFLRLNYAHRDGNNYTLSPRALAFLRKINALPY